MRVILYFLFLCFVNDFHVKCAFSPLSKHPSNNPNWATYMNDAELTVSGGSRTFRIQYHPATFGPNFIGDDTDQTFLSGRILFAQDSTMQGCAVSDYPSTYPGTNITVNGSCIAVAVKGACLKALQVLAAQATGCKAMLLSNCDPDPPSSCTTGRTPSFAISKKANYTIPSATITYQDAMQMFSELQNNSSTILTAQIPATGPLKNKAELDALVSMSKSIKQDPTQNNWGTIALENFWKSPTDPCIGPRVMAISCKNGSIFMIDSVQIGATGIFPVSIVNFSQLEIFSFDICNLNGFVPQLNMTTLKTFYCSKSEGGLYGLISIFNSVANIPNLEVLMVAGHFLTQLPPDLNILQNLRYLCASQNRLTNLPTITSSKLIWLQINGNNIASPLPNFSGKQLIYISLASNKFTSNNASAFFNDLPLLLQVDISSNNISGPVPTFSNCPSLQAIVISKNLFTGGIPTTWDNKTSLLYVDASNNMLTGPFKLSSTSINYFDCSYNLLTETYFSGAPYVGLVINFNLPRTLEIVNLAFNRFSANWINMQLVAFTLLKRIYLQNNTIVGIPPDLFISAPASLLYLDLSNNKINGDFPSSTPSSNWEQIHIEGNPGFISSNNYTLPSWMIQTAPYIKSGMFSCPSIIGNVQQITGLSLIVTLDPIYYNYKNCVCERGYYKSPPFCENIPNKIDINNNSVTLTDSLYGNNRLTLGVDIAWVLSPNSITNSFYINIYPNKDYFNQFEDIIEIYASDSSLQGQRVISFRGTDPIPLNNINVPEIQNSTYVVLNNIASIVFRSRKMYGTHFTANFTTFETCPENYQYDFISGKCQILFVINAAIQFAAYAIISVLNVMLLLILAVLIKKRNSLIIRSSSFPFCASMLCFMILLGIGSYFYIIYPDKGDFVCNMRPWLTAGPLVGMLAALLVKVDRIRRIFTKIFTSRELTVQTITNTQLAKTMIIMLSLEFTLLIAFTTSKMSQSKLKLGTGYTNNKLVAVCTSTDSANGSTAFNTWLAVQFFYIAVFLVVAVMIAWSVRKVPSAFNEAPSIASSLLSLVVLLIILIPLNYVVDDNPNALMLIRGLGQVLVTSVLTLFFFGPKLYLILEGKDNDQILSTFGSSTSSSTSSIANDGMSDLHVVSVIKTLQETISNVIDGYYDTNRLVAAKMKFSSSEKSSSAIQIINFISMIETKMKSAATATKA